MNSSFSIKGFKQYTVAIVCGLIFLVSLAFIIPGIQSIMTIRNQISAMESIRASYDLKITVLGKQNLAVLKGDLTNSVLALPTAYDSPSLLNALEKLSQASSVSFSGLQFSQNIPSGAAAVAAASAASEYSFSLSTTTDYPHVVAMMRNFENTLPIFTIKNLSLHSSGEADKLAVNFGVTTYYQALPTTLGAKDAPVSVLTEDETKLLSKLEGYSNYPLIPDISGVGKNNPFK